MGDDARIMRAPNNAGQPSNLLHVFRGGGQDFHNKSVSGFAPAHPSDFSLRFRALSCITVLSDSHVPCESLRAMCPVQTPAEAVCRLSGCCFLPYSQLVSSRF